MTRPEEIGQGAVGGEYGDPMRITDSSATVARRTATPGLDMGVPESPVGNDSLATAPVYANLPARERVVRFVNDRGVVPLPDLHGLFPTKASWPTSAVDRLIQQKDVVHLTSTPDGPALVMTESTEKPLQADSQLPVGMAVEESTRTDNDVQQSITTDHLDDITVVSANSSQETHITRATRSPFYGGGATKKYIVSGFIGSREVSLIERPDNEYLHFAENWKLFKDNNLPVAPTLRHTLEGTVLTTNMTADGSGLYGKGLEEQLQSTSDQRIEPAPGVDDHFIKLTSEDYIGDVAKMIDGVVAQANAAGVQLPPDDYFDVHVHRDGTFGLFIPDLEHTESLYVGETASKYNSLVKEASLDRLVRIRALLMANTNETT